MEVHLAYSSETITYAGSLVDEFYYNEQEQSYFLKINPKLAALFNAGWTQLQWKQRLQLKADLAKWLHGFYASHRDPVSDQGNHFETSLRFRLQPAGRLSA